MKSVKKPAKTAPKKAKAPTLAEIKASMSPAKWAWDARNPNGIRRNKTITGGKAFAALAR